MSHVFEKIRSILDENHLQYEVLEHAAVFTSEEAARVRETSLKQAAKALVFQADGMPLLLVIPGDRRVDTRGFKKSFNVKDLRMATREEVQELAGIPVGAIPPFGNVMGLPTYLDRLLLEEECVVFNAGSHTRSIRMSPQDLVALVQPTLGSFSR